MKTQEKVKREFKQVIALCPECSTIYLIKIPKQILCDKCADRFKCDRCGIVCYEGYLNTCRIEVGKQEICAMCYGEQQEREVKEYANTRES